MSGLLLQVNKKLRGVIDDFVLLVQLKILLAVDKAVIVKRLF